MTAVIPAAGLGTRMLSATGGKSKELLRLGTKTVLKRVIEEARVTADQVIVVSSPKKPDVTETAKALGVQVVEQLEMKGFAHAIGCAAVEGDMVVLLGDCAIYGESPTPRMASLIEKAIDGLIAVEQVPDDLLHQYGIVDVNDWGVISKIVEKPSRADAPSNYAICARYAFSGPLTAFINQAALDWSGPGELGLTEVLNQAILAGFELKAVPLPFESKRADVGTPEQYAACQTWDWN